MKRQLPLFALLALCVVALPVFALPGPSSAVFDKGAKFTVSGYTGSSPLSGFPVLVRIAENSPSGFSYDDLQSKSTGDDIAFVDMSRNGLPFEIDTWNPSGASLVWVRLPTMTNGTEFVMCWGSTASGKAVCNANPWSAYTGVWHMGETETPSSSNPVTIHDSTENGLDGSTETGENALEGKIGGARRIAKDKAHAPGIVVDVKTNAAKKAVADSLGTDFHASFWMRTKGVVDYANVIGRRTGDNGTSWGLQFNENNGNTPKVMRVFAGSTTKNLTSDGLALGAALAATDDVWKKVDIIWKSAANNNVPVADIYLNGAFSESVSLSEAVVQRDANIGIGCSTQNPYYGNEAGGDDKNKKGRRYNGEMDEVRLGAFVPTADWIAADHATQSSPGSFLTAGTAEPYAESGDPVAGVSVSDVSYTSATVTATVVSLGTGATSADVDVQVSAAADFSSTVEWFHYSVSGGDVRSFDVTGLSFGTTYYARAKVVNAPGAAPFVTGVATFTTPSPGAPSGTAAFLERGYTTISATATASYFGTGSQSATIRLEASTDGFTNVVASTEIAAVPGRTETLVAENLEPGASYRLRVRIRNDWGLETYFDLPDATTHAVPFAVTGLGWTFSPNGSTADFTFGVSAVFDGATGTATLEYDGRTFASRTFSSSGTLVWPGVPTVGRTATATVTVTATVGGTTYTHAWTATVEPGSAAHVVSSLSDLSGTFFRAGDSVVLPELAGADYYVVMDVRSFSLGEDGVTLTALEPGFSTVVSLAWDGATSSYAVSDRALAVCIPEVKGSGRVFFAKPGARMDWEDTSKWTNVTDPSAEADFPHRAGDIAMVALPDDQLVLNTDATVAELYLGPDEDHMHTGTQRLTGRNAATLTFARPSGKPGLLRFTGMFRTDTPALTNGWNQFAIGGGDGNSKSTGLGIEMPGGLEFDCGAWPDYTDTTLRSSFGRARYFVSDSMRYWNIPEGRTLRISNTSGRKQKGDSQDENANFNWLSGSQVTGSGTFFYDAASSFRSQGMFRTFRGIVKVANKQAYDTFDPSDRGGGFKFRPELYSSFTNSTAKVAADATLLLEGDANGSSVGSSFGVVNAGHTHGYGSWERAINAYPAKKWILDGGYVYQTFVGSTDVTWREDGTTATPTVCTPNGAATLCVSNGFNYVRLGQANDAAIPTNSLVFGTLEHAGDGVLVVRSDRLYYSYNKSGWRDRVVLGGFHDLAIGGTGRAVARHGDATVRTNVLEATAPIVPWIVSHVEADSNLFFPGADNDTDELVLAGYPRKTVLDEATDPTANVRVDGTTIALSADRTVNSLVLANNRNSGKNLGAGRTLTITSGGLIMGNGNWKNTAFIGDEAGYNAGTAGTLVFPNKAYVFVPVIRDDKNEHPEIWAKMVSPQGAVFSYPGDLHLGGDQTGIDDHIAVNGTDLRLGTATTGCQIDVPVHLHGTFARLRIGSQGSFCKQDLYFWDHLTPGAKFEAAAGTEETVHKLFVDGVSMPRGYYGSSDAAEAMAAVATYSFPAFVDDNHFIGTGWIKVQTDECRQPMFMIFR